MTVDEAIEFLKTKGWEEKSTGMYDRKGLASVLIEYAKELQHHKDTTIGLWATDRPDLIEDPKNIMFQIS